MHACLDYIHFCSVGKSTIYFKQFNIYTILVFVSDSSTFDGCTCTEMVVPLFSILQNVFFTLFLYIHSCFNFYIVTMLPFLLTWQEPNNDLDVKYAENESCLIIILMVNSKWKLSLVYYMYFSFIFKIEYTGTLIYEIFLNKWCNVRKKKKTREALGIGGDPSHLFPNIF